MNNFLYKLFLSVFMLYAFFGGVSADHNIRIDVPGNNTCVSYGDVLFNWFVDEPVTGQCNLYTNKSGVLVIDYYLGSSFSVGNHNFTRNFSPGSYQYRIGCTDTPPLDTSYSDNYTMLVVDKLYCAVLTDTSCDTMPNLNNYGVVRTRLGNTRGFYLEAQDGQVFIEKNGVVVKTFNTMVYNQETALQVDNNGNFINVVKPNVPLTDSNGYYIYEFPISGDWAHVGDTYNVTVSINGELTRCEFKVNSSKLPDMENWRSIGKNIGGFIVVIIVLYGIYRYWRRF